MIPLTSRFSHSPERGSFPLDHDNECKPFMTSYLSCIKRTRGINQDDCRQLSKAYLQCRMDKNLMAVDEMKNLGFAVENHPTTKEEVHREHERVREEREREGR